MPHFMLQLLLDNLNIYISTTSNCMYVNVLLVNACSYIIIVYSGPSNCMYVNVLLVNACSYIIIVHSGHC